MQQNNFGWASMFGIGAPQEDDLWTEEERKRLQRARMQAMGSGLLEASGWSSTPVTFGQAWANASGRGQEAQQYAEAGLMQRRQMTAAEEQKKQWEAMLATLPPDQAANLRPLGPQEGAKALFGHRSRMEQAGAKPAAKPNIQKEAEILFPGDPEAQRRWIMEQRNKPTGTTVTVSMPGDSDRLGRLATPEEVKAMETQFGMKLPPGVGLQMTKNGWQPIQGTLPTAAEEKDEVSQANKQRSLQSAEALLGQVEGLAKEVASGPWMEPGGVKIGAMVSQKVEQMDRTILQLHTQVRSILRIPGEGALSDREQEAYGLAMPSARNRPETNLQLIQNLRMLLRNAANAPAQPTNSGFSIIGVE